MSGNATRRSKLQRDTEQGDFHAHRAGVRSARRVREPDRGARGRAWAVLSESLVIREQLNQACVEVKVTIDAIKMRLDRLALKIVDYDGAAPHPADQLRRRVS